MTPATTGNREPERRERHLAFRRTLEDPHRRGPRARGGGDFLLYHRHTVTALIRLALRCAGLYRRGLANARIPRVRELRFRVSNLPAPFDGFRILHIADLHIGGIDGHPELLAGMVAELPADLCVFSGDYRFDVAGDCPPVYAGMKPILEGVRTRYGPFGILGNHDCSEMVAVLEGMGLRILVNESVEIRAGDASLWLAGTDDPHYFGCDDLPAALEGIPDGATTLLLAHSPELYREADEAGVDLYLCGHTHGGQLCLPRIGPIFHQAKCPRIFAAGSWRFGNVQGDTSRGVGCSLLATRYNCPPELCVVTLERG